MGNLRTVERLIGLNYVHVEPKAQYLKVTLWIPGENLSFGLLPYEISPRLN